MKPVPGGELVHSVVVKTVVLVHLPASLNPLLEFQVLGRRTGKLVVDVSIARVLESGSLASGVVGLIRVVAVVGAATAKSAHWLQAESWLSGESTGEHFY